MLPTLFLTVTTLLAGVQALPSNIANGFTSLNRRQDFVALTDQFIFQDSMTTFINDRQIPKVHHPNLDWDSDGCSVPEFLEPLIGGNKNAPFGNDFTNSCLRHDFAYRNYKKQNRFNAAGRKAVDDKFRADMKQWCAENPAQANDQCEHLANLYWGAVRVCGGGLCHGNKGQLAEGESIESLIASEPDLKEVLDLAKVATTEIVDSVGDVVQEVKSVWDEIKSKLEGAWETVKGWFSW